MAELEEMVAEEEALAKGTVVAGRYRIVRPLAEGGMGQVYVAHDERVGRDIALKVLRREFSARKDLVGRFRREAKSASSVKHESILVFTDCGFDGTHKVYFLCSELLEGEELRALMNRGGLSLPGLFEILLQVCSAIEAAHRKGVVHRDLKPENIYVSEDRRGILAKVLDFGIAKVLDETATQDMRTRTNVIVGTPGYMSPEQHMAKPVDGKTDVFAIGCIFYEALSGREPFEGASLQAITISMMQGVRERLPNQELEAIAERALKWEHAERMPSARAFADELEAYQARHPEVAWIMHAPSLPSPTPTPTAATPANQAVIPEEASIANLVEIVPEQAIGNGGRKPTHVSWSGEAVVREPHFLARHVRVIAVAGAAMMLLAVAILAVSRPGDSRRISPLPTRTPTTTITAAPTPTPVVVQQPSIEPTVPAPEPTVELPSPQPSAPPVVAERPSPPRRRAQHNAHALTPQAPISQRRAPHCADERYRYRDGQCCRRRSSGALDCDGEIER